jgi:hypothetical protein
MKTMLNSLKTLLIQVMEARVIRLNLLMQQVERNLNDYPCCDTLKCCIEEDKTTDSERESQYYFHK